MTITWPSALITQVLSTAAVPSLAKGRPKSGTSPETAIDVIITFDADGVSSHPNHKSLYHGSKHFLTSLMPLWNHEGATGEIELYTLTTTSIFRKYLSVLDVPITFLSARGQSGLTFVSSISGWRTGQKAMTTAHVSQMRWFRWGWIGLSRYMVVNDLMKEVAGV